MHRNDNDTVITNWGPLAGAAPLVSVQSGQSSVLAAHLTWLLWDIGWVRLVVKSSGLALSRAEVTSYFINLCNGRVTVWNKKMHHHLIALKFAVSWGYELDLSVTDILPGLKCNILASPVLQTAAASRNMWPGPLLPSVPLGGHWNIMSTILYHGVHVEICPFLSPLSSGSLINVFAIHHHETGIIGWVINHCLLWELWSVYLNAQESHLIVDIFVHMLTARDSPVIPAAPCLRLPKPYIIAFTLSQETFNASLSVQQYKSGSFVFHLRKNI